MSHQPIRVCHLAYTFYEYDGRVMKYVETLLDREDYVDVIALRRPGSKWFEKRGHQRHFRLQTRSGNEKGAFAHLLKLILFWIKASLLLTLSQMRRSYDVIHVHNIPDFLVFAAWFPKLCGARIILDIHDLVPELYSGKFDGNHTTSLPFRLLLKTERLSCAFADHVIVANHPWHGKLASRSVPSSKCSTIMNYPDLQLFSPIHPQGPRSGFRILYPGSLNHHQGLDLAIKALSIAREQMPDAELHIYGTGPAMNELTALSESLGLSRVVRFFEPVGKDRIAEVINSASVGVVPKRADGFGNEAFSTKTLEFMACAVPLIVSRTMIDSYYFSDDVVTFFTPGDADDLARALVEVYTHPKEAAERVSSARALACELSWQSRYIDYRALIDSLAACTAPAAA